MAVIYSLTESHPSKWYAAVGLGLALTVPAVMLNLMSDVMPNPVSISMEKRTPVVTNAQFSQGTQSTLSLLAPELDPNHDAILTDRPVAYEMPRNLGLPKRREPGGTR